MGDSGDSGDWEIRELWVIGKNRYMWQKWGTVVGANAWEADELGNLGLGSFRGLEDSGVWEVREIREIRVSLKNGGDAPRFQSDMSRYCGAIISKRP